MRSSSGISLKVSGLSSHSSLAVSNISTKKEEDCIVILVHLVVARSDLTGNFTYVLDVPEEVEYVCFGKTKL